MDITIIFVSLIVALGGFTQGLTGFGLALVSVPLLSFVIDAKIAVPIAGIFGWVVTWPIVWKMRHSIQYKTGLVLVASSIPATFIGARLLATLPSHYIAIAIGIILIFTSLYSLRSSTPAFKKSTMPVTVGAGFSAGMLGALGGPPVVAYTSMQPWTADESKSTLAFFFWLQMIGTLISFWSQELITDEVISYTSAAMPALLIGTAVGMATYATLQKYKINYQRVVHCFLFVIGCSLVLRSVNF